MSIPGGANLLLLASAAAADAAAGPIKSVRFNSDDSAYLNRTPSSAGNRKIFTISFWFKTSGATATQHLFFAGTAVDDNLRIRLNNNDMRVQIYNPDLDANLKIANLFRDPSAWYHFVLSVDTTASTASDRMKAYINGVEAEYNSPTYPTLDSSTLVNNTNHHYIGAQHYGSPSDFFDGYMADFFLIDGSALDCTSFGAFDDNGVWQSASYSGTFGTNGFHLFDFASESTVGHDSSGNENDFTANNISSTAGVGNDILFDVPTNGTQSDTGAGGEVSGCYPTWNPLSGQHHELLNGNLEAESGTISSYATIPSTIAMTSGKWYAEFKYIENVNEHGDGSSFFRFGISQTDRNFESGSDPLGTAKDFGFTGAGTLRARTNGSNSYTYTGNTVADGDILSLAFDADAGKLWVARNGTWATNSGGAGDPANGNNPDFSSLTYSGGYVFVAGPYAGAASPAQGGGRLSAKLIANWGQRSFAYSAPSGFKALNTASMSAATIADGSDYFDAKIFTGNGSSQTISGLEFAPDLVWIKNRSDANDHVLSDTVRGAQKYVITNKDDAELTSAQALTAFTSDGFSVGNNDNFNNNTDSLIAWAWDAGSSTASNTDGDITSSVRANQTAGFSIVKYSGSGTDGDEVGHGLNAKPESIWFKGLKDGDDWQVWNSGLGGVDFQLFFNTDGSRQTRSSVLNSTEPTSSVFTLGNYDDVNASGTDYIAYCFAPVAGYSSFGSYEGNGSATDGPFVNLNFAPAFLLVKRYDSTGNWILVDQTRGEDKAVYPNKSITESSASFSWVDLVSNGFKIRSSITAVNADGGDYVYWAFASNPFSSNGGLAR